MENPKHVFTGQIFNSYYQNNELKMKVRWVGARKKMGFFLPFILFSGNQFRVLFHVSAYSTE